MAFDRSKGSVERVAIIDALSWANRKGAPDDRARGFVAALSGQLGGCDSDLANAVFALLGEVSE